MTAFLLFDAYGTLVELDDFYGRLQRGFARHGLEVDDEVMRHAAHAEMRYYIKNSVRARDHDSWLTVLRECARVLADALEQQGVVVHLMLEQISQTLSDAIAFRAFPETRSVLATLQTRGIALGVLSNWDYHLAPVMGKIGLAQYFAFTVSSSSIGIEKPAPEAFAHALELARDVQPGLNSRDCYYVGDHYEKDVLPARAAGMTPLWLIRNQRDLASGEADFQDDKVIRLESLTDLLQLF